MTVRRSLAYSFAESNIVVILQLIGTVIISRLLTPEEVGIFAVAAVFAAIASTFRDFGVGEYLIQEKALTDDKIRAALAVNIAVSWAMAAVLFLSSESVAAFFRTPNVAEVIRVQALNFLLIPFGAVTMAYFRRQLDFKPIFIANTLASLTSFMVATLGALAGLGYMSLAWSSLAGVIVTVCISLLLRPTGFPRWPGLTEVGSVIRFGKHASGIYIAGQVGKHAPEIILGRALDMASVAFFSRASGLIEIFHRLVMRAVLPVCLPYFAKTKHENDDLVTGYLRAVSYLTIVAWPFFTFCGISAYAAIRIVYGDQWLASVPLAQILCAAACIEIVHFLAKEVLIAAGRVDRSNWLQAVTQGCRIVGLLAVIPYGLEGAAWGLFAASVLGFLFAQQALACIIKLRLRMLIQACAPGLWITLTCLVPAILWVAFEGVTQDSYIRYMLGAGALTTAMWLLAIRLFSKGLWSEIEKLRGKLCGRASV